MVLAILLSSPANAQIWSENFDSYANGTINAAPKWTSYATDCDDGGNINSGPGSSQWGVWDGVFTVNDVEGDCCPAGGGDNDNGWLSEVINLAGFCDISVTMSVTSSGSLECDSPGAPIFTCAGTPNPDNSHDQVVVEYKLDNGAFQSLGYVCGDNGTGTLSVNGLNGNSLQLRFFVANKANAEYYYIDNIVVAGGTGTIPLFNPIGPLCENSAPVSLPGTSTNGITGTWNVGPFFNPAGQGGNTVALTFTPNPGQCAATATLNVVVTAATTITPAPIGPFCTQDPPVQLPGTINGINGSWTGQGVVSGNVFNPAVAGGNVTLTFTPFINQCAQPVNLPVVVNLTPTANATTIAQCGAGGSAVFNLSAYNSIVNNQPGSVVTWYLDPNGNQPITSPGSHAASNGSVVYAIVTNGNCVSTPAAILLSVTPADPVAISGVPSTLCQTAAPVALPTVQNGVSGQWSGPGVSNNTLNPAGLSGPVTLTFTPAPGQCALGNTFSVQVNVPVTPSISGLPTQLCDNAGAVVLPTNQGGVTGNWSGAGVAANNFNPAGLSGPVAVTFTPVASCATTAGATITVLPVGIPVLESDTICVNSTAVELASLADPAYPNGSWSGPGVSNNIFNPAPGATGLVTLNFAPSTACVQPASTTIAIIPPPFFTGLSTSCDLATQTFTVSFTITGGDPDTYTVDGNPSAGNFTSDPFPSGATYTFEIDDAYACGPVIVSGTYDCSCTTSAGTMEQDTLPIQLCHGAPFTLQHNGDENITLAELLRFMLHDNPGAQLGNVIAVSSTPSFQFPAGVNLGQTYYVSAVAGLHNGTPEINLSDPCLSVSPGVPVVFYAVGGAMQSPAVICETDCAEVQLQLEGIPPFELSIQVSGANSTLLDTIAGLGLSPVLDFCPETLGLGSGVLELALAGLIDANGCSSTAGDTLPEVSLEVLPVVVNSLSPVLCPGASISVNGVQYDPNQPAGTEVIANGSFQGCDSVINVSLSYYPPAEFDLNQVLCSGDSLLVGDTWYHEGLTAGTVVLPAGAANGCDSTIHIELNFNDIAETDLAPTLCPGGSLVANGSTYDETNPAGTEVIPGGSYLGCDSVVQVSLSFYQPALFLLSQTLCTGGSLNVNGSVYDESQPGGTETIPAAAANGCDSIIVIDLSFVDAVEEEVVQTLCPGESIEVGGNTYDEDIPAGTELFPGGSYLGCDSVVNVSLSFFPVALFNLEQTLCEGESLVVNGSIYDKSQPSGVEILPGASSNGCDSTIIVNLSFNSDATQSLVQTLCTGESLLVGNTVYDEDNPTGTTILQGSSYLGCDSVVAVNLSFYPPATLNLSQTLCPGGSLIVNGTEYSQGNPTGTEVIPGGGSGGCDSVITVSLSFYNAASSNLSATFCQGEELLVAGTVFSSANPSGSAVIPEGSFHGCDSTVFVNLSYFPPAIGYIAATLESGQSLTVNGVVYDEQNPAGTSVLAGASYTGCDSVVQVQLLFIKTLSAVYILNSPTCQNGTDGFLVIDTIEGGLPPFIVQLSGFAPIVVDTFPLVFDNLSVGFYQLRLEDADGVEATEDLVLDNPPALVLSAGEDQTVDLGLSTSLSALASFAVDNWSWSPADYLSCLDCPDPTVLQPGADIAYTLTALSVDGCAVSDEVSITVVKSRNIFVPNAFSPNNDGINDWLTVFAGPNVSQVRNFQVFDRWGNQLFRAAALKPGDLSSGWDGTFRGALMDAGVYVWFAEVAFVDGEVLIFEGDVMLVR